MYSVCKATPFKRKFVCLWLSFDSSSSFSGIVADGLLRILMSFCFAKGLKVLLFSLRINLFINLNLNIMSEEVLDQVTPTSGVRPGFLTTLCVLTFIGSGLGLLAIFLLIVAAGAFSDVLSSIPGMDALLDMSYAYLFIALALAAASLYGAIQMWKLKKMGFSIYAGANVAGLLLPVVFGLDFSVFSAIIVILFIALYYVNVKHMS